MRLDGPAEVGKRVYALRPTAVRRFSRLATVGKGASPTHVPMSVTVARLFLGTLHKAVDGTSCP